MEPKMSQLKITINEKQLTGKSGQTILETALENGIEIPNLCHDPRLAPTGACRMCLVEVQGQRALVTACTFEISDGMVVKTDTPSIRRLQRSALQLLLSVHDVACASCPVNKKCELQNIAKFLKIGLKSRNIFPTSRNRQNPPSYKPPDSLDN